MASTAATREQTTQDVTAAGRARHWIATLLPLAVVAVTLLLVARVQYYKHGYLDLRGFATLGSTYSSRIGITSGWVGATGYDGQFYYYLALRPSLVVTCAHDTATCPLDALRLVRAERILYPMTARLVALGQPDLIPIALLLVNFVAILITAVLLGSLAVGAGASRWLGAAAALYAGETLVFASDLGDPYAVMWLVLAVWLARRNRWLWAALAVAAALLTREQLIFVLPLLALPLIVRRAWRMLAASAALALGPFAIWQIVLHSLYGAWPILSGDSRAAGLMAVPFLGLWQSRGAGQFTLELAVVAVPLLAVYLVAALALWQQVRGTLRADGALAVRVRAAIGNVARDPIALMAGGYGLLVGLLGAGQWVNLEGPLRLALPAAVLGAVAAAGLARWVRIPYAVLLAGTSVALLAGNVPYIFGAHPAILR